MIELIYKTFERIGYPKPLHPSMTHVSVGLLSALFIFALVALLLDHDQVVIKGVGFVF